MAKTSAGRRRFLGGLLAAGVLPAPTWADAGAPAFLSAAMHPDGTFVLCGIGASLDVCFEIPLPARGHAAAAHPTRPEAVAFARRPGTFAVILDCVTGQQRAILGAPAGRHFYGHGAFSADGSLLYTTENDYDAGKGRIGVWDTTRGYLRTDEWDSGGIGPHDIKRLPGTDMLVVANGGIDTHPDTGRTKLNIPTMAPNLAYIESGNVVEVAALPPRMHMNSIRHLAIGPTGEVALGMQWEGAGQPKALVGLHRRGAQIRLMQAPPDQVRDMDGYIGSIAVSADGAKVAVTSPRGGQFQQFDAASMQIVSAVSIADVCGVTNVGNRFIATSGNGALVNFGQLAPAPAVQVNLAWDNHLIRV
jgi:hypothetical protein